MDEAAVGWRGPLCGAGVGGRVWGGLLAGIVAAAASVGVAVAQPAVDRAESAAFGASVEISIAGLLDQSTGRVVESAGTAPAPYDESESAAALAIDGGPLLVQASGTVDTSAVSTVDGAPGLRVTGADVVVEDLSVDVATLGFAAPTVALSATAVDASVEVSGSPRGAAGSGAVSITGLSLDVLGVGVDLSALGDLSAVVPGTSLDLGPAGLANATLFLNELEVTGSPDTGFAVSVNAIRLHFDAVVVAGIGVLSGDVTIGHADALQATDTDGDGADDGADADSDGDGIPDVAEIVNAAVGGDTDGDGVPDFLDLDSDDDGIDDVVEAGGLDADGDGLQDPSGDGDADEDGDGLVDSVDGDDAVSGGGTGSPLPVPDTDGDGQEDYLDLDADGDGIGDLVESGQSGPADVTGFLPPPDSDGDGIADPADGLSGFGDAPGAADPLPDADGDGIGDAYESDRDNDGTDDIASSGHAGLDGDSDGRIDDQTDADADGIADSIDTLPGEFGGIVNPFGDADGDGIENRDEGNGLTDTDSDGVVDIHDSDSDSDGIPDGTEGGSDFDGDGIANARDLDSDNDGINDVAEGGGTDADGDGMQDASGDADEDEDGDGLVDSADPDDPVAGGGTGSALPLPDSDGDTAPDYLDLDSDNDTISDLVESASGTTDADSDGVGDGDDPDRDGIVESADGLPGSFGDAMTPALPDSDGDGLPNHLDPDSDAWGAPDIVAVGNSHLDTDGDGRVDAPADADMDGIADTVDAKPDEVGGLPFLLKTYPEWVEEEFDEPGQADPEVSGQLADPDLDGYTNADEFAFGSDPNDPGSTPDWAYELDESGDEPAGMIAADKDPSAYAFVIVEVSRELVVWSSVPADVTVLVDTPAHIAAMVAATFGFGSETWRGFMRFRVVIP